MRWRRSRCNCLVEYIVLRNIFGSLADVLCEPVGGMGVRSLRARFAKNFLAVCCGTRYSDITQASFDGEETSLATRR